MSSPVVSFAIHRSFNARVYDERRSVEPTYPSLKPYEAALLRAARASEGVLQEIENEEKAERIDEAELLHAPPGYVSIGKPLDFASDYFWQRPCYESLMNNVPTPLVEITNQPWPIGTENFVNHKIINQYIRAAAELSNLRKFARFDTVVDRLRKQDNLWTVTSRKLTHDKNNKLSFTTHTDVRRAFFSVALSKSFEAFRCGHCCIRTLSYDENTGYSRFEGVEVHLARSSSSLQRLPARKSLQRPGST